MKSRSSMVVVLAGLFAVLTGAQAGELGFGRFYTDNMVLQRDKPVVVRGTAPESASVTLTFDGRVKTATADKEGQWSVTLDASPVSKEPKTLSVASAGKTVTLKIADLKLANQQSLKWDLKAKDGTPVAQDIQHTIHEIPSGNALN